ncbi:hypothetical protein VSS74_04115 [Conexibacter stalactiti]|uniref:Uncharacterized protein n=1 Tax=Conexibacter stalactiti TaxID=1940611 RepID=A0ABU4HJK7_9ACTN|nr:hypothetical protein [Conexibacter stalactiti]MDW5593508.1 hypothetical protein [Conexibacter stalactiti]MEC5034149.1 hypothetical protein [Conexibacter stalactiti]
MTYRAAVEVGLVAAAHSGEVATFGSWGSFASAPSGLPNSYRAHRGEDGWRTEPVSPLPVTSSPDALTGFKATWTAASSDLRVGVLATRDAFDPFDVNDAQDVYVTDGYGTPELVARGDGAERPSEATDFSGISRDGSAILFRSRSHLVPEDAARIAGGDLYLRREGTTTLLNQMAGGGVLDVCGSQSGSRSERNAISADGLTVFFETPSDLSSGDPACTSPKQVYARNVVTGATVHISRSQRGVPDPNGTQSATFEGASEDGRLAFFTSVEQLTDEATVGGGLYRYDMETATLTFLLDSDSTTPGIAKISADGTHIYFASYYELVPGRGMLGGYNLYVLVDGRIRWVATDETGFQLGALTAGIESTRPAVVTPDGRHLMFATDATLSGVPGSGGRQVYLYDDSIATLTCLSCDPARQRPAGSMHGGDASFGGREGQDAPITDDGETAVFDTLDQLVAEDTNATRDVYEFRDGRLRLVSPGRSNSTASLVGMAGDGRDVFFTTSESLVPWDIDGGDFDLYDARIGGGFPVPTAPPVPRCAGDSCQGPASVPPASEQPASESLHSESGDEASPAPTPTHSLTIVRPSDHVLRAAARNGRLAVTLRTTGGGSLSVRAVGRLRGTERTLASARRRISSTRRVTTTVTLTLSAAARRSLNANGRLGVRVVAQISNIKRTAKLTLRLAQNDR